MRERVFELAASPPGGVRLSHRQIAAVLASEGLELSHVTVAAIRERAPAAGRLGVLRVTAGNLPTKNPADDRRRTLLRALRVVEAWPTLAAHLEAEETLAGALVAAGLPRQATDPARGVVVLFGALVVPRELADAAVIACGSEAVALGVLRAAVTQLEGQARR